MSLRVSWLVLQLQQHEQFIPLALSKVSRPSLKVSQAISMAPIASRLAIPVSSYPALEIMSTTDRYTQAREQAASARMAGEPSAVPTLVFWRIKYHIKDIDSSETTIP